MLGDQGGSASDVGIDRCLRLRYTIFSLIIHELLLLFV